MAQEHQKSDSSTVRWKLFSSSPSRLRSGHRRKIIHCSLNFGSDPATDKKRLILKGAYIENRIFLRLPGVSDPAADVEQLILKGILKENRFFSFSEPSPVRKKQKRKRNENELLVPKSVSEGFSNCPKHPQFVFPASGRGGDITLSLETKNFPSKCFARI